MDNHPEVLDVARDALKRAAYDVVTANGAEKALAILAEDPRVDVLLAEVLMPGVGGAELLKTVRQYRPEIAPVLMSGYTGGEVLDSSIVFLPKPFTAAMLLECVASALRRQAHKTATASASKR